MDHLTVRFFRLAFGFLPDRQGFAQRRLGRNIFSHVRQSGAEGQGVRTPVVGRGVRAVADGVNVGCDIYRIKTQITQGGSKVEAGFSVDKQTPQAVEAFRKRSE